MDQSDFDALAYLELLPGKDGEGFIVWLFDYKIGEGETVEAALDDAKNAVRRWVESDE